MSETEQYEEKSFFEWGREGQEYDLLKTIVAFANCQGGRVTLHSVSGDVKQLDSARLDDFVNKHVSPRIGGIASTRACHGAWTITVEKSELAPHVMEHEASFRRGGKTKSAFHQGQVYVRHSSKSEPAQADDLHRLIREAISSWLSELGEAVAKMGSPLSKQASAMPVRLVDGGPSLAISLKPTHPYTASEIGEPLGKKASWIGKLVNRLGIRTNPRYVVRVPGGKTDFYRFSELAKKKIGGILERNPQCNPYSCRQRDCSCIHMMQPKGFRRSRITRTAKQTSSTSPRRERGLIAP